MDHNLIGLMLHFICTSYCPVCYKPVDGRSFVYICIQNSFAVFIHLCLFINNVNIIMACILVVYSDATDLRVFVFVLELSIR